MGQLPPLGTVGHGMTPSSWDSRSWDNSPLGTVDHGMTPSSWDSRSWDDSLLLGQ